MQFIKNYRNNTDDLIQPNVITDSYMKTIYDNMLYNKALRSDIISKIRDAAKIQNAPMDFNSNLLQTQKQDLLNQNFIDTQGFENKRNADVISLLSNPDNYNFITNADAKDYLSNKTLKTLANRENVNKQIINTENSDNSLTSNLQYNKSQIEPLIQQNNETIDQIQSALANNDIETATNLNNILQNNLMKMRSLSEVQNRYDAALAQSAKNSDFDISKTLNKIPERDLGVNSIEETVQEFAKNNRYENLTPNTYYKPIGNGSYNIIIDIGGKKYKNFTATADELKNFIQSDKLNNNTTYKPIKFENLIQ